MAGVGLMLVAKPLTAHELPTHGPAPSAEPPTVIGGDDLPFAVGGPFALVDHTGRSVTEADFLGRPFLVFFGYSNCKDYCPLGLRTMLEALDLLGERGAAVQPVMITVDPAHDTSAALAAFVAELDPRLTALTGTPDALASVRKAYNVRSKEVSQSLLTGEAIFGHGSNIYLMDAEGGFLTLLPPIVSASRMAEIIAGYLARNQG